MSSNVIESLKEALHEYHSEFDGYNTRAFNEHLESALDELIENGTIQEFYIHAEESFPNEIEIEVSVKNKSSWSIHKIEVDAQTDVVKINDTELSFT